MDRELTHFDSNGKAIMVDISEKTDSKRTAEAKGCITMNETVYEAVKRGTAKKGDVLGTARIAGIMAAKKTSELIPLCHVIMLTKVSVDFEMHDDTHMVEARCMTQTIGKTGVEMEALTGVQIALLTIYDMCKAMDRGMVISDVCLVKKDGGKSGLYER